MNDLSSEGKKGVWTAIALGELLVAGLVIYLDLLLPTLVIIGICVISLVIRKEGLSALGFKKLERPARTALIVLAVVLIWTVFHLAVSMPVLNHLTGTTQDLSSYEELQGNLSGLIVLLVLTWTLAAFAEEVVFRGYLFRRVRDVLGDGRPGIVSAVVITSLLFGMIHLEQGVVGVALTTMDAVVFCALRLKFADNLWPAIMAHGFNNTIGMVAVFFVGPIYGLW